MSERQDGLDTMARGLGWVSLVLGAVQLGAPEAVRRMSGVDDSQVAQVMVPLAGVRQLFHMAVLLGSRNPEPWVWTRVAGDAVDLTALGCAISRRRGRRRRRAMTATAAVAAITAVDVYVAVRAGRRPWPSGLTLHASTTVKRPREEVYRAWRNLENLPWFMVHLRSVEVVDQRFSHWVARGPAGTAIVWDAEIVEDRPAELVAWRSTDRAMRGGGVIHFTDAPGGRGTEVWVELCYDPPGGVAGAAFTRLLGKHPDQRVRDDLRRFKQIMETGEVVRSDETPVGGHAVRPVRRHPAQPVTTGGIP